MTERVSMLRVNKSGKPFGMVRVTQDSRNPDIFYGEPKNTADGFILVTIYETYRGEVIQGA